MGKQENDARLLYENDIQRLTAAGRDVSTRTIKARNGELTVLFIRQLTDRDKLSEYLLKPLLHFLSESDCLPDIYASIDRVIEADNCWISQNREDVERELLSGMTVVLFSQEKEFLTVNLKSVAKKNLEGPELTYALRAPSDSFIENLDTNLSLIRYRIKDPTMRVEQFEVGRRTRTRVAVCHIENIADDKIVRMVTDRIRAIDVDGIIESGELQKLIAGRKEGLFPETGIVERSDMACGALLEGKVVILVEGSGIGLIAPKLFIEYMTTCDDNYDHILFGSALKVLRLICMVSYLTLSAIFIALMSFNYDVLPTDYAINAAMMRTRVPFNSFVSVLMLETILEILREALIRVPKSIGPAIGIVGATIIGQAAIASGIFSPILLMLVSISFLSSFVAPDYTIMNPLRLLKLILVVLTGMFGFIGFSLGLCVLATILVSNTSYDIPFLTPFAPFNWYDLSRSFVYGKQIAPTRPGFLRTKDKKRI